MATKQKQIPVSQRYTYRTSWSPQDQEFVATVLEFPSLSWLADSRESALKGLTSVVEEVLKDMLKEREEIPEPWSERTFSGKLNLRLGQELHKKISLQAAEQNESINTFIVKKLSSVV